MEKDLYYKGLCMKDHTIRKRTEKGRRVNISSGAGNFMLDLYKRRGEWFPRRYCSKKYLNQRGIRPACLEVKNTRKRWWGWKGVIKGGLSL